MTRFLAVLALLMVTACSADEPAPTDVVELADTIGCEDFVDQSPADSPCTVDGTEVFLVGGGFTAEDTAVQTWADRGMHWASNGDVSVYGPDDELLEDFADDIDGEVLS
jgi:hypothetical protein